MEFSFIKGEYPNLHKVIGDDLDLGSWPKGFRLEKTDLWFIDSLHEISQLKAEYDLYKPYFKSGCVILIDDIKLNSGMWKMWVDWEGDKYDASAYLHWSGFGIVVWK